MERWRRKPAATSCREVQGTDAAPADRVGGDIELPPELDSGITVDDFDQRFLMDVANGAMEEARPHRTVRFDDGRDPGRVASRGHRGDFAKLGSKMAHDPAQFLRALRHKPTCDLILMLLNEQLDLLLEGGNVFTSEGDGVLAFRRPAPGAVECLRGNVGRKKRNRIQPQLAG